MDVAYKAELALRGLMSIRITNARDFNEYQVNDTIHNDVYTKVIALEAAYQEDHKWYMEQLEVRRRRTRHAVAKAFNEAIEKLGGTPVDIDSEGN